MENNIQTRSVAIPVYKFAFFKTNWMQIYTPLVDLFDLQICFNLATKSIDLRSTHTNDLERCAQFINAILYGFSIQDSAKMLKSKDIFVESFRIQDVKKLQNDHLSRAVGRIIGREGKIKKAIETATNTKIVLKDNEVFILGSVGNIEVCKRAICKLIMGSEPAKVCNTLTNVTGKIKDRVGMFESITNLIE
ncbi:pre-rRNA-processing protein pno1 [Binucleata daphniae]